MNIAVNFWAVLVAAIAQFIIGWIWYGPLFGKLWLRLHGKTKEQVQQQGNPNVAMLGMFIASLITAYVLAHFVYFTNSMSIEAGCQLGFWVWLGFVATVTSSSVLFEGKSKALYLLTNGYYLVSLAVMGAILAAW